MDLEPAEAMQKEREMNSRVSSGQQDEIRQMIAQTSQQMQHMQTMAMQAITMVSGGRFGAGAGTAAGPPWRRLGWR